MHTNTSPTVDVPQPRRPEQRRIALGVPIFVSAGVLRDCTVTVRIKPLGQQWDDSRTPFAVTITPQPTWRPPSDPGDVPFNGAEPVTICASAADVAALLEPDGYVWR